MIRLIFFSFVIFSFSSLSAQKKSKKPIVCTESFYTYRERNKRIIGNVYEFKIQVNALPYHVNYVWFGATPIPCDVYELKTNNRIDSIRSKGIYWVRCNKDLYKNFPTQDSIVLAKEFKAPYPYKGGAILVGTYKKERHLLWVKSSPQRPAKGLR